MPLLPGGSKMTARSTGVSARPVRRCSSLTGVMEMSVGAMMPPMASICVSSGVMVMAAGKTTRPSATADMPESKLFTTPGAMYLHGLAYFVRKLLCSLRASF